MMLYSFSEILKEIMCEQNLTQTELAKKCGFKQSQVSEWLSEKAKPGYDSLRCICICLNVSAEYILGISD